MARILLVGADTDDRDMYEEYLTAHGHEVAAASTTDTAEPLLRSVDLLITELIVGGTRSVVSLIAGAKSRMVPVVVVTGWIVIALQREASAAGVDEILLKPCFPEDLLNAVERMLARHGTVGDNAAPLRSSLSSDPGNDPSNDGPLPTP